MKKLITKSIAPVKFIIVFFATFLVYHIIFSSFFPVDENNVLQAPDWYVFVGMAVALVVAFIVARKKRMKSKGFDRLNAKKKDELYQKAVECIKAREFVSHTYLEYELNIDFSVASNLIDRMKLERLIEQNELGHWVPVTAHKPSPLAEEPHVVTPIAGIDNMEGHAFEYWCADLLKKVGYQDVEVTRGSGDQGVDILAKKDGVRYAVQCKCYSSNLGNTPIQEVHAGKSMYHCQVGAVMTNRYFTQGGKELAENTGVLLWDRDWIEDKLNSTAPSRKPSLNELVADAES